MLLQRGLRLLQLIDKEDYAGFNAELNKMEQRELMGIYMDVVKSVAAAFTDDPSSELEKAMDSLMNLFPPSGRMCALKDIVVLSKFSSLTRIILHSFINEFDHLGDDEKAYLRYDILLAAEREMMKELKEEEREFPNKPNSAIDTRLYHWLMFIDAIGGLYLMRSIVIYRTYRSSPPYLVSRLALADPLSPVVVAEGLYPHVYSPPYAYIEVICAMAEYLECRKDFDRKTSSKVFIRSLPFLIAMGKEGSTQDSTRMIALEGIFSSLLPSISDYSMGEKHRKEVVDGFNQFFASIPQRDQPLILKRIIRLIKDKEVKIDAEAHVLSFVVDLYKRQLNFPAGVFNEPYIDCLGDLWSTISNLKYDDPSQACMFYQSVFLLANLQVRLSIRPSLLSWANTNVLSSFQQQVSDYCELRRLQEKAELPLESLNLPFIPQIQDDSLPRLYLLMGTIKDTVQLIQETLKKIKSK